MTMSGTIDRNDGAQRIVHIEIQHAPGAEQQPILQAQKNDEAAGHLEARRTEMPICMKGNSVTAGSNAPSTSVIHRRIPREAATICGVPSNGAKYGSLRNALFRHHHLLRRSSGLTSNYM
jgi:hypothetical protein